MVRCRIRRVEMYHSESLVGGGYITDKDKEELELENVKTIHFFV